MLVLALEVVSWLRPLPGSESNRWVLIDHDRVEEHNLDRLLNATVKDIGRPKVEVAAKAMRRNGTAKRVQVTALPMSIQDEVAYLAALDCDVLFGCVDRPVPLEILNYAAHSHLIPVFSGAVEVQTNPRNDGLFSAHWRAHTVNPLPSVSTLQSTVQFQRGG